MASGKDISIHVFAEVVGFDNHIVDHPADGLPCGIKVSMLFRLDVTAVERIIQPRLGFIGFTDGIGQLADKGGGIAAMPPRFSDHGFDRARRPADLIGQREPFFFRERLGCFKYARHFNARLLVSP